MAKKSSSKQWLREHFTDPYVKQAQQEGYRSRSVYKLKELQERDYLFKPGMTVIDLGAAPGGWCQYVVDLIKPHGKLIAIDLLPMEPLPGVQFIQGDFASDEILNKLLELVSGKKIDWIISDMAPNMSGNESVDIPRSMYLNELALDFAKKVLLPTGGFLIKVFQGEGFDSFLFDIKQYFQKVAIRKPKASRGRSREVYILARGIKGE